MIPMRQASQVWASTLPQMLCNIDRVGILHYNNAWTWCYLSWNWTAERWEKFQRLCGWHLISLNSPPRQVQGYYTIRVGWVLDLYVGVGPNPLVVNRCKNLSPPTPHGLHMFRFMITFASCFIMRKAHRRETFSFHKMVSFLPCLHINKGYKISIKKIIKI